MARGTDCRRNLIIVRAPGWRHPNGVTGAKKSAQKKENYTAHVCNLIRLACDWQLIETFGEHHRSTRLGRLGYLCVSIRHSASLLIVVDSPD